MVYGKSAYQDHGYGMAWKVLGNHLKGNSATRDGVITEHAHIILSSCNVGASNTFTFVLAGIPLKVRIQFFDAAIKAACVVVRRKFFNGDHRPNNHYLRTFFRYASQQSIIAPRGWFGDLR